MRFIVLPLLYPRKGPPCIKNHTKCALCSEDPRFCP